MALIYRYRILPGKKGTVIKTPSIPVLFKGENSLNLDVVALVDSGADCSIIPKGLAEVLGLDLSGKKQESFGIIGKIECIESELRISLKQNHERYELKLPILISPEDSCPIILGRREFFDNFKVTFDNSQGKIILRKIPVSSLDFINN